MTPIEEVDTQPSFDSITFQADDLDTVPSTLDTADPDETVEPEDSVDSEDSSD